ncbi:MAG: MerR family transcriptional regulator [Nitrospiraceae bacterium]|nr:MerR family transcriptional regulator [Nitrospiraceae bacterium]
MEYLTTGRLAKEAGVNIDTVRYYEKRGLIPKPPRKDSGYRMFREDAVKRIIFIKHAQEIGFSLHEIEELLFLRVSSKTTCHEVKKRTEAKIVEVEGKILNLQRIKRALEKMADICRANKRIGDCPILDMLDAQGDNLSLPQNSKAAQSASCPSCGAPVRSENIKTLKQTARMKGA